MGIPDARPSLAQRTKVFLLTALGISCFMATRKPASVVKEVLHHKASTSFDPCSGLQNGTLVVLEDGLKETPDGKGWAPFNTQDGEFLLGLLDSGFLITYAVATILIGGIGDKLGHLRVLIAGLLGTGITCCASGLGYFLQIHSFWYFFFAQVANGVFQTVSWPCSVAIMAKWFGKGSRGSIMGLWCGVMNMGDILGMLSASMVVQLGWGWSFIIPGLFTVFMGGVLFLFLEEGPPCAHMPLASKEGDEEAAKVQKKIQNQNGGRQTEMVPLLTKPNSSPGLLAIHPPPPKKKEIPFFFRAFFIPGVIPFAMCLFFTKLVSFSLSYWLPFYMSNTCIGGTTMSVEKASNMTVFFYVGGILGEIVSGVVADVTGCSGVTALGLCIFSGPVLYALFHAGTVSWQLNGLLLVLSGALVKGAYSLISGSVSADLGNHPSLQGSAKAAGTVTAIVGGIGSLGSAVGPAFVGHMISLNSTTVDFTFISWVLSGGMIMAGAAIVSTSIREVNSFRE